jgi:sugar/nucleoside kinase (ribokinase family)
MRPVAVLGSLACDVVDRGPPRVGGGPFHAARALRLLGRPARIATKCAEADRDLLLPPLVALGVPVRWRAAAATTRFSFSYEEDRRSMSVEALGEPWTADEARGWVAAALRGAEWVQVAPLVRGEFDVETLAELARGRRVLLDGQGLVREPRTGPLALGGDADPALLRSIAVLKLAEEEALALAGGLDEAALASLHVPEVVVTFGSRGCLVLADGRLAEVRARPVSADPTGAGDAFGAAYVTARNAGQAPLAAARRATALVADLLRGRTS